MLKMFIFLQFFFEKILLFLKNSIAIKSCKTIQKNFKTKTTILRINWFRFNTEIMFLVHTEIN
jgi:hypothetical protein